jgi:hypothetical protein
VISKFHPPRDAGISWFAITEADGSVRMTSVSPLGNLSFPSTRKTVARLLGKLDSLTPSLFVRGQGVGAVAIIGSRKPRMGRR